MDGRDQSSTPSPPHSDDSTVPSSSVQTIIHQHPPMQPPSAATFAAKNAPTPSARQQVPAPNATELRAPPLPLGANADVTDFSLDHHTQHLYNTPIYDGGNLTGGDKKPAGASANPKDDVEIFSSQPVVVHVPKGKGKAAKDSASASSSITLLTGADADTAGVVRNGSPTGAPSDGPGARRARRGRCAGVACVWLAVGQLLCSVALTAVGVLMWTRGATFAHGGAGLWAGAVGGVAGALGVINERKARTGYLAVSLICVASSTLAMALTGIGLVRDLNANTNRGAVTAASGLLVALAVHFLISVLAVYYSAMQQCSSRYRQDHDQLQHKHQQQSTAKHHNNTNTATTHSQLGDNIVYATGGAFCGSTTGNNAATTSTNPAHLSRQRVEQYFRSLPRDVAANGGAPMHNQKMMQMAKAGNKASSELYGTTGGHSHHDKPMMPMPVWTSGTNGKPPQAPRPMMLVPAGLNANLLPIYHPVQQPMAQPLAPPPQMLYPPHLAPPGMLAYHHRHHPHHAPPASTLAYTHSLMRPHHRHHHHHHPHHMPGPPPPQQPHPHYSSTLDAALLHPSEQPHRMHRGARGEKRNTAAAARRRKSESDRNGGGGGGGVSNPAFVYHGLDRAIADSFLKEQERQNVSIECTSLSGRGADVAM